MINGNMIGIGSAPLKTVILEDENGNTVTGVVTGSEVIFDVTPADVRINKTFAGNEGIQVGENTIIYRTTQGLQAIPAGSSFTIPLARYDAYNYTKLQCILSPFDTSIDTSCAVDKTVINNCVYNASSAEKISDVVKNHDKKSIDLNIVNSSSTTYFIRYFTYKEEE